MFTRQHSVNSFSQIMAIAHNFAAIFVLASILQCEATLDLYRDSENGFGTELTNFVTTDRNNNSNSKHAVWNLGDDFQIFGQKSSEAYVHFNGFITFDIHTAITLGGTNCQFDPNNDFNIVVPYWRHFDKGSIYVIEYDRNSVKPSPSSTAPPSTRVTPSVTQNITSTLTRQSLEKMAADLRSALDEGLQDGVYHLVKQRTGITADKIEKVFVFTWYNMYSQKETISYTRRLNQFQAALIKVNKQWFVQYYFGVLSSDGDYNPFQTMHNQACQTGTKSGIGRLTDAKNPRLKGVFSYKFQSSSLEVFSNQYGWRDLGSWIFDINKDVQVQPLPIRYICDGTSKDHPVKCALLRMADNLSRKRRDVEVPDCKNGDKKCEHPISQSNSTASNTTTEYILRAITNKYCRYRDPGLYHVPAICNMYIICSLEKKSRMKVCGKGKNFNPRILSCDPEENYQCNEKWSNGTSIASIPRNVCEYRGFGEFPDPSSCDHYYACTNSRSIKMSCPSNLYFKVTGNGSGYCEFPASVNCLNGKRENTQGN